MEVTVPRYVVPYHCTIASYTDRQYISIRNTVEQELKDVQYLRLTMDVWMYRANDGYVSLTSHQLGLSTNSQEDDIENADSSQPPAKRKKIHPLRKLFGNNFY